MKGMVRKMVVGTPLCDSDTVVLKKRRSKTEMLRFSLEVIRMDTKRVHQRVARVMVFLGMKVGESQSKIAWICTTEE